MPTDYSYSFEKKWTLILIVIVLLAIILFMAFIVLQPSSTEPQRFPVFSGIILGNAVGRLSVTLSVLLDRCL